MRNVCPDVRYIAFERGQFDVEDVELLSPALTLDVSCDWQGRSGRAAVVAKIWVMHYADDDAKAARALDAIEGLSGENFNSLQASRDAVYAQYRRVVLERQYYCELTKPAGGL